jgi:hypothetical protein
LILTRLVNRLSNCYGWAFAHSRERYGRPFQCKMSEIGKVDLSIATAIRNC